MVLKRDGSLGRAAALAGLFCAFMAAGQLGHAASGSRQAAASKGPESRAALNSRCIEAADRAERDAAALIPHRPWTWRLDFERSRRQVAQLRSDFTALHDADLRFDATLTSAERKKLELQRKSIQEMWSHLDSDADSLDAELRKGYPTRWHVARDASDMEKEIRRWKRLHEQIARQVGATR